MAQTSLVIDSYDDIHMLRVTPGIAPQSGHRMNGFFTHVYYSPIMVALYLKFIILKKYIHIFIIFNKKNAPPLAFFLTKTLYFSSFSLYICKQHEVS